MNAIKKFFISQLKVVELKNVTQVKIIMKLATTKE